MGRQEMRSYLFIAVLTVFGLFLASNLVSAEPPSISVRCKTSCTVAEIVEWSDDSFPPINLMDLTAQNSQVFGSSRLRLYTNGNVEITADNSDAAQLSKDNYHKLVTEYKLEYDAFGVNETGGSMVDWSRYDLFLSEGSIVTHIPGDGAVEVTLSVRVSKDGSDLGNSLTQNLMSANLPSAGVDGTSATCTISCTLENVGECTATQTLTAYWES
jgi:hypothetical protein